MTTPFFRVIINSDNELEFITRVQNKGERIVARPSKRNQTQSKRMILQAATKLFLERGYSESRMADIAKEAGVSYNEVFRVLGDKEGILCELVGFVVEGQFEEVEKLLKGKTDDLLKTYAAEATLQLFMAESNEGLREMYNVSYSLNNSAKIIYHKMTETLEKTFKPFLPNLQTKDFYEREIASAGIMRNFISVPCDMYFTMQRKVRTFLTTTFLVYEVPKDVIEETIEFVFGFDWEEIARKFLENMFDYLSSKV